MDALLWAKNPTQIGSFNLILHIGCWNVFEKHLGIQQIVLFSFIFLLQQLA